MRQKCIPGGPASKNNVAAVGSGSQAVRQVLLGGA